MNRTILMLEHDDDDRYITQTVFDEHQYPVKLLFVTDSDDFWKVLKSGHTGKAQLPSLILLSYYAGGGNAIQLLKELKSDIRFSHLPVIILSGSVSADVVKECYREGASTFVKKPSGN